MQISEDTPLSQFLVTAYQDDTIWVNHIPYQRAIILTPNAVFLWENTADFTVLLSHDPELIVIGTGKNNRILPASTLMPFYDKNIGVEVMNTQAACRTYNLLANEGRRVVAGLIL